MTRKYIILIVIFAALLSGCYNNQVWDKNEFVDWYSEYNNAHDKNKKSLAVYYDGSSSDHHHFIMRPFDSWLLVRINKNEIKIVEEIPHTSDSSAPFPGYYKVNPMDGFKRIK